MLSKECLQFAFRLIIRADSFDDDLRCLGGWRRGQKYWLFFLSKKGAKKMMSLDENYELRDYIKQLT